MTENSSASAVTTNACKQCAPLGATVAFKGIEGAMPFIHGGQGCATYIRRYLISHFKEPVDVASSSFSDDTAIFGGESNLRVGLDNVARKYAPSLIGVSTTCLAETIGENLPAIMRRHLESKQGAAFPLLAPVSTPSYRGTHVDGFNAVVRAVIEQRASASDRCGGVNVLPGFVSCADLRHLKEIIGSFDIPYTLLPDYSDTLDAPTQSDYVPLADGGTTLAEIAAMAGRDATIQMSRTLAPEASGGSWLAENRGVPLHTLGLPIGIRETDRLVDLLSGLTGRDATKWLIGERGRLIDAYIDGHKYVFEKKVAIYGEEDLVAGLTSLVAEIGMTPVLCASGGASGKLAAAIRSVAPNCTPVVREGADFKAITDELRALKPDLMIGNSKGYKTARELGVPLVRAGFPIHDRIGGSRLLHLGYRGAQRLFDEIVNTLIARTQDESPVGYSYM
ncbi:MAG: nitrogenase component 1 [Capsulimonadaceae bacterium]|nr:nitrogenase component 1 [Capsulimonadaceae bacterium]